VGLRAIMGGICGIFTRRKPLRCLLPAMIIAVFVTAFSAMK
jgi:hypothetical protein